MGNKQRADVVEGALTFKASPHPSGELSMINWVPTAIFKNNAPNRGSFALSLLHILPAKVLTIIPSVI